LDEVKKDFEMAIHDMEEQLEVFELFQHQGMGNASRAFCDVVLDAFYKACGKGSMKKEEKAKWLLDQEPTGAQAFVTKGVTLVLFDLEKKVNNVDFSLLKCLRKASTDVSYKISHRASPIEVATALEKEGRNLFEGQFRNVCAFYQAIFKVSSKQMVKDWKEGRWKEEFRKKFKALS